MEIDYLREFALLARTGSFLMASEQLMISQSSLSKHIRAMEGELGLALFERTTRKIKLTEFGEEFYRHAAEITRLQYEFSAAVQAKLQFSRNVLSLGAIPAMSQYAITDVIAHYFTDNATFSLSITEEDPYVLSRLLNEDKIELAFSHFSEEAPEELARIDFDIDRMLAVFPAGHELAKRKRVSLESLRDENLLLLERGCMLHDYCIRQCRMAGFEPKVIYAGNRIGNIIDLIKKGLGVALIMNKYYDYASDPELETAETDPVMNTKICLTWRRDRRLSPAASHFIRCAKAVKHERETEAKKAKRPA